MAQYPVQLVQAAPHFHSAPHFHFDETLPEEAAQPTCCEQLLELIVLVVNAVYKYIYEFFYGEPEPAPPAQAPLINLPNVLLKQAFKFLEYEDFRNAQAACKDLSRITLQEWINACKIVNFTPTKRYPVDGATWDEANRALTDSKFRHFLTCDFKTVISVRINWRRQDVYLYLYDGTERKFVDALFAKLRSLPNLSELAIASPDHPPDFKFSYRNWEHIVSNLNLRRLGLYDVTLDFEEWNDDRHDDYSLPWLADLQKVPDLQSLKMKMPYRMQQGQWLVKIGLCPYSLSSLQYLPHLTELEITDWGQAFRRASDLIENIGKCAHLRILSLSIKWEGNERRDLTPLLNCTKLQVLRLANCTNLEEQHIQHLRGRNIIIEVITPEAGV